MSNQQLEKVIFLHDANITEYNEEGMAPGFIIQCDNFMIHTFFSMVVTTIPFEGTEQVCWDCKKNRSLEIVCGFKKNTGYTWGEICGDRNE